MGVLVVDDHRRPVDHPVLDPEDVGGTTVVPTNTLLREGHVGDDRRDRNFPGVGVPGTVVVQRGLSVREDVHLVTFVTL